MFRELLHTLFGTPTHSKLSGRIFCHWKTLTCDLQLFFCSSSESTSANAISKFLKAQRSSSKSSSSEFRSGFVSSLPESLTTSSEHFGVLLRRSRSHYVEEDPEKADVRQSPVAEFSRARRFCLRVLYVDPPERSEFRSTSEHPAGGGGGATHAQKPLQPETASRTFSPEDVTYD